MDNQETAVQQQDAGEGADSAKPDVSMEIDEEEPAVIAISSRSAAEETNIPLTSEEENNQVEGSLTENHGDSMEEENKIVILNSTDEGDVPENKPSEVDCKKNQNNETKIVILNSTDEGDVPENKTSEVDSKKNQNKETKDITEQWESEVKALQEIVISSHTDQDADDPFSGSGSDKMEITASCKVGESAPEPSTVEISENHQNPASPNSDKEADLSGDALLIDESEAAHSESVADVSHTSSGTLDSQVSDIGIEAISKALVIRAEADKELKGTKKAVLVDVSVNTMKASNSIEESIERCIAKNIIDSAEEEIASVSPVRKSSTTVSPKSAEASKFPRNYGFKIITNKIDLTASPKGSVNVIPKLREGASPVSSSVAMKRVQITQQSIVSEEGIGGELAIQDSLSKPVVKIAFQKSTEEPSEKTAPKERPTLGLKVRDVESINAAIRTVKAPICSIPPDETNSTPDPISSASEKLPDKEVISHVSEMSTEVGPEAPTIVMKSALRPLAPKCEPIASNDQQAIKLIRDLIQLPSIPVYVPDVSESKYFNGRLHLCHGCGDRFVLLKSLLEHQNRRSCIIKFQCLKCDSSVLCFFNRCEFIRHLYNHNQTLTNVMCQYHIIVERLPDHNAGIFNVRICHECKVFLKIPLEDHMQGLDMKEKSGADLALKCQWCCLLLPTRCAYQAHRRMHFLQPPHTCPECGDPSTDLPSFNVHINSVCFHTSKRSVFQCTHCKAEMYDARKLERHIRTKHIRDVFKCNFCFVACFNLKDLERHRRLNHAEKVAEEPEDDDDDGLKYAFHLCDMCPNRLIRRVRLGQHVWDHTYSNNEVNYVYECRKCKVSFSSKDVLAGHASVCSAASTANTQAFATVITNGSDVIVQQPNSVTSELSLPVIIETQASLADSSFEEQGNFSQETAYTEEQDDEDDMMVIDETVAPPPLQKAPVTQPFTKPTIQPFTKPTTQPFTKPTTQPFTKPTTQPFTKPTTQPVTKPVTKPVAKPLKVDIAKPETKKKKKKSSSKKSPVKPDFVAYESPKNDKSVNNFESEGDCLDPEEGGPEVVLNCLDCGTNLTSELGSYCTLCEQQREAGESFAPVIPSPAKKKKRADHDDDFPLKGGNFTCRICKDLICETCDKQAIKRHFILKHKEIFIAALQSGMSATKDGPKTNKPNILTHKRTDNSSKEENCKKRPSGGTLLKQSPKKRKKLKKPIGGRISQTDTEEEDDDYSHVTTSPSKEKKKEKRKKSYSPAFPVLEQGMVAQDERGTETSENVRTCYKCSFKSADKEEFMTHVATHKINSKDLQCPACGMCFVVRPSLEKHLLISHGTKNVEEYLLEHGFPPVEKNPQELDVDMLDVNQCKVCRMRFDSEALLEKHFRTHGSAFLLSKKFRRS